MKLITVKQLQQEFRLPFTMAEATIHEQTALARQHYRRRYMPACVTLAVAVIGASVLSNPWTHTAFRLLWPVAMLCVSTTELLAQRWAQAPILAAARAAAPAG